MDDDVPETKKRKLLKEKMALPPAFAACLRHYEVIEGALGFLARNRVSLQLDTVAGFVDNLQRDVGGASPHCTLESSITIALGSR